MSTQIITQTGLDTPSRNLRRVLFAFSSAVLITLGGIATADIAAATQVDTVYANHSCITNTFVHIKATFDAYETVKFAASNGYSATWLPLGTHTTKTRQRSTGYSKSTWTRVTAYTVNKPHISQCLTGSVPIG